MVDLVYKWCVVICAVTGSLCMVYIAFSVLCGVIEQFKTVRAGTTFGDVFDKTIEYLINDGWEIVSVQSVSAGQFGFVYDVAYLTKGE